jgi:hypothetical protein
MRDKIEKAFKRFVKQKWKDAEPVSWESGGTRPERPAVEKQAGNLKKLWSAGDQCRSCSS